MCNLDRFAIIGEYAFDQYDTQASKHSAQLTEFYEFIANDCVTEAKELQRKKELLFKRFIAAYQYNYISFMLKYKSKVEIDQDSRDIYDNPVFSERFPYHPW